MAAPRSARGCAAALVAAWMAFAPSAGLAGVWERFDEDEPFAAAEPRGLIDRYSRWAFGFNQRVYDGLDAAGTWVWGRQPARPDMRPDPAAGGVRNVVTNLVNEPLTAVSSLAIGEFGNALRSVQRFGINSTAGVLGYYDTAAQWGYAPTHTDLGLTCAGRGWASSATWCCP